MISRGNCNGIKTTKLNSEFSPEKLSILRADMMYSIVIQAKIHLNKLNLNPKKGE